MYEYFNLNLSVLIRGCEWDKGDHLKYKYGILSDPEDQIRDPADRIRFFISDYLKMNLSLFIDQ